jgi:host factor-I protein
MTLTRKISTMNGHREPRPLSPNIQDAFLNQARRDRLTVQIRLVTGDELEGRIKNFDKFAVIVEHSGADHMIFKHAIASIRSSRQHANYYVAPDDARARHGG